MLIPAARGIATLNKLPAEGELCTLLLWVDSVGAPKDVQVGGVRSDAEPRPAKQCAIVSVRDASAAGLARLTVWDPMHWLRVPLSGAPPAPLGFSSPWQQGDVVLVSRLRRGRDYSGWRCLSSTGASTALVLARGCKAWCPADVAPRLAAVAEATRRKATAPEHLSRLGHFAEPLRALCDGVQEGAPHSIFLDQLFSLALTPQEWGVGSGGGDGGAAFSAAPPGAALAAAPAAPPPTQGYLSFTLAERPPMPEPPPVVYIMEAEGVQLEAQAHASWLPASCVALLFSSSPARFFIGKLPEAFVRREALSPLTSAELLFHLLPVLCDRCGTSCAASREGVHSCPLTCAGARPRRAFCEAWALLHFAENDSAWARLAPATLQHLLAGMDPAWLWERMHPQLGFSGTAQTAPRTDSYEQAASLALELLRALVSDHDLGQQPLHWLLSVCEQYGGRL